MEGSIYLEEFMEMDKWNCFARCIRKWKKQQQPLKHYFETYINEARNIEILGIDTISNYLQSL